MPVYYRTCPYHETVIIELSELFWLYIFIYERDKYAQFQQL